MLGVSANDDKSRGPSTSQSQDNKESEIKELVMNRTDDVSIQASVPSNVEELDNSKRNLSSTATPLVSASASVAIVGDVKNIMTNTVPYLSIDTSVGDNKANSSMTRTKNKPNYSAKTHTTGSSGLYRHINTINTDFFSSNRGNDISLDLLLPNNDILKQTIHNLIVLLQIYGPLTLEQLEYNLPSVSQSGESTIEPEATTMPTFTPEMTLNNVKKKEYVLNETVNKNKLESLTSTQSGGENVPIASQIPVISSNTEIPSTSVESKMSTVPYVNNEAISYVKNEMDGQGQRSVQQNEKHAMTTFANDLSDPNILLDSSHWTVADILEILTGIGLIQVVENEGGSGEHRQYCMLNGVPRHEVIFPDEVSDELYRAYDEVQNSHDRCTILEKALIESDETKTAQSILQQVLMQHPDTTFDPVYVSAYRNCNVDLSKVIGKDTIFTARNIHRYNTKDNNSIISNKNDSSKTGSKSGISRTMTSKSKKKRKTSESLVDGATANTIPQPINLLSNQPMIISMDNNQSASAVPSIMYNQNILINQSIPTTSTTSLTQHTVVAADTVSESTEPKSSFVSSSEISENTNQNL